MASFAFPGDKGANRAEVLRRLIASASYRKLFGRVFPEVGSGAPITFDMFGKAIAEFECGRPVLVFEFPATKP